MVSSKYSSTSFRPFAEQVSASAGGASSQEVKTHEPQDWSKENRPTYSQIKETFEKNVKKKDQRFFLSELVAGQLSVEEEEQRRFEKRLKEELELRVLQIKEQAYADGYEVGLKKGIEKAFEEERARIAARLELLASAANDVANSKEKLTEEYEKKITDFAFQISEIIVESEIKNRPESVGFVVKNILDILSKEEDVKVHIGLLSSEHLEYVKDEISKLNRKGSFSIEIREDLNPGDVIVQTISGEVSARVEDRIKSFKQEMKMQIDQHIQKKAI